MAIDRQRLVSFHVDKLKGINDLDIDFGPNKVTGIFGVNCSGKSTILHALACMYQPEVGLMDENYKFSRFFKTDRYQNWVGSRFSMNYAVADKRTDPEKMKTFNVNKRANRWNKDYGLRPKRDVYFIGIASCIPQIELEKPTLATVKFEPAEIALKKSKEIKDAFSFVFNTAYQNVFQQKKLAKTDLCNAVECAKPEGNIKYTALSMGAGEQRVILILQALFKLPKNSLLLIDEIDLTLHTPALLRLIEVIQKISDSKSIQTIFTSHRAEILELPGVNTRFIVPTQEGKTLCLNNPSSECIESLSNAVSRPLKIFVEDEFAKAIVCETLSELKMRKKADIQTFGDASNAFTVMAGLELNNQLTDNIAAFTDGDVFRTEDQRLEQMKRILSGTEDFRENQRKKVVGHILQFNLPEGVNPEQHVHTTLKSSEYDDEITSIAKEIHAVIDKHGFINEIVEKLGEKPEIGIRRVIQTYRQANPEAWTTHTANIREWLLARKDV